MKHRNSLAALLFGLAATLISPAAIASGDSEITLYTPAYAPRHAMAQYLDGKLGVIDPTFFRRYLFFAYRQFEGLPFTTEEKEEYQQEYRTGWPDSEAQEEWLNLAYPGGGAPRDNYRNIKDAAFIYNCPADAFQKAMQTYKERSVRYGVGSQQLARWMDAQRMVFANCAEGEQIPEPLPVSAPQLERQDRAYQIAASHFYATHYQEAASRFEAIAKDTLSPWAKYGAFLAARAYIRMGSIAADPVARKSAYAEALRRLGTITADPALAELNESAEGLKYWIALRIDENEARSTLTNRLLKGKSERPLAQELVDFEWLLDQIESRADPLSGSPADAIARDGGLVDWIFTVQEGSGKRTRDAAEEARKRERALQHALAMWKKSPGAAWPIAALLLARSTSQLPAELLTTAAQWQSGHPGYPTAQLRLLSLRESSVENLPADKQAVEHALILDRAKRLLGDPDFFADGRNALREVVMRQSDQIEDLEQALLLEDMPSIDTYRFGEQPPPLAEENPTMVLGTEGELVLNNALPLSTLEQLVVRQKLPKPFMTNLVVAAWTRSIALGDHHRALRLSPYLGTAIPALAAALKTYTTASAEERDCAAADILVRHPALTTHMDADPGRAEAIANRAYWQFNWWCPARTADEPRPRMPLRVLSAEAKTEAAAERSAFGALENGTNSLARRVLARAETHPTDPRVPEDLHRMVGATRGGCIDEKTPQLSKTMFRFLHRKYKNSEWTRKTPIHY